MRCLLTGGAGFLGRMLAAGLRESGAEVLVADLSEPAGFAWQRVDITRPETLRWTGPEFDLLVHAAGLAHFRPRTPTEQQRLFEVNADGTRNLLASLGGPHRPARAVLVSTVAVYGRQEGEGLDENTPLAATDPYGESKRLAEGIFRAWSEENGVGWTVLRLPLVYGLDPPGNLGAMAAALRAGRYVGVGRGQARRSLVWGVDVGRALLAAAREGGVFHLTDGRHPTFREIEEAMAEALGRAAPPRLPAGAAWMLASAGSALTRLGLRPPFDLDRYRKMTRSLTFNDARARAAFGWNPSPVTERIRREGLFSVPSSPGPAKRCSGAEQ
ncbi:MAG: NAD-dependent epimerase/dehydratase family protein [Bryobacteraceae bacterium]